MGGREGRFEGRPIVGWSALALLSMAAILLAAYGTEEAGVRVLIRATARTSLPLFLAAFVASSARRLWRSDTTAWLLRNRRYVGVSFATSHGVHLAAIVTLAARWPESFWSKTSPLTLYGGGLGYVFIFLLALTSSDAAVRRLGRQRWKLLHRIGVWYLFGIFLLNYGPSGFFSPAYIPASLAVLAALGLRIAARWRVAGRVPA
jgi:DMSO/TMAO reductase YedYZ heme-binding membrane subunit